MQIAAANPICVSPEQIPVTLAQEREIFLNQAKEEGKPAQIAEKIVEGRIRKYYHGKSACASRFHQDDKEDHQGPSWQKRRNRPVFPVRGRRIKQRAARPFLLPGISKSRPKQSLRLHRRSERDIYLWRRRLGIPASFSFTDNHEVIQQWKHSVTAGSCSNSAEKPSRATRVLALDPDDPVRKQGTRRSCLHGCTTQPGYRWRQHFSRHFRIIKRHGSCFG